MPTALPPPPHPRRRSKRSDATREAIKAAAAELFARRGFRITGVRDIADRAGFNQALVAYHFGGKGELYDEILHDAVEAVGRLAGEARLEDSDAPERELVRIFMAALSCRPFLPAMVLREQMDPERMLTTPTANTLRGFMTLTEAMLAVVPMGPQARSWDPQIVHLCIIAPIVHFLVTTPMREAVARAMDRPVTLPSPDEFSETLGAMLSRALRDRG